VSGLADRCHLLIARTTGYETSATSPQHCGSFLQPVTYAENAAISINKLTAAATFNRVEMGWGSSIGMFPFNPIILPFKAPELAGRGRLVCRTSLTSRPPTQGSR
jgi:hypothetical protein